MRNSVLMRGLCLIVLTGGLALTGAAVFGQEVKTGFTAPAEVRQSLRNQPVSQRPIFTAIIP